MIKTRWFSFLTYKAITFGDFTAHQFVLFKCKYLFTILFFYFTGKGWQDRFHTHAFNAISVKFFGTYQEELIKNPWFKNKVKEHPGFNRYIRHRTEVFRFFPRNEFHRLGYSDGCMTMLISGPWKPTWEEIRYDENEPYRVSLDWSRNNTKRLG